MVRPIGLAVTLLYGGLIVWLYASQPQTVTDVAGGIAASIGAYRIDRQAFDDGLVFFRKDQFEAARAAWRRADPAQRDAETQFYIAYSYYRQGWGRVYHDRALFAEGLEAVDRAIAVAPRGRGVVEDDDLGMQSADELRAELQQGIRRDLSDYDPRRVVRERK